MFRRKPPVVAHPAWLIVGLGNPGPQYRGTRHNVGFDVVDRIAELNKIRLDRSKHHARYGAGQIGGVPVVLAKPLTYMNLSGRAVGPLARELALKPARILVVADDLDLPLGRIRLKPKGSAGGHNGHKSLIAVLGEDYPRLKIGIGRAHGGETIDHVLGTFDRDERDEIDDALRRAVLAVEKAVEESLEAAMNLANQ